MRIIFQRFVGYGWIASIDHSGSIGHAGDVIRQLDRKQENIEALLAQAAANRGDLAIVPANRPEFPGF